MRQLVDDERRPDPRQAARDRGGGLADRSATGPPHDDRGSGRKRNGNEPQREPAAAGDPEHRNRQQCFLRAAVRLAPEERRQLTMHRVVDHQPDHGLVAVGDAERRTMNPDTERDTGDAEEREQDLPAERRGPPRRHERFGPRNVRRRRSNERTVATGLARARCAGGHGAESRNARLGRQARSVASSDAVGGHSDPAVDGRGHPGTPQADTAPRTVPREELRRRPRAYSASRASTSSSSRVSSPKWSSSLPAETRVGSP